MDTTRGPFLSRLTIRTRMLLLAVCSVGLALAVTCAVLLTYNFYSLRSSTVEQLSSQAQMLAFNSSGVLSFRDKQAAEELLASLRMFPSIESAVLIDQNREIFASYPPDHQSDYVSLADGAAQQFTNNGHVVIRQPVIDGDVPCGMLILYANLDGFYVALRDFVLIVAGVMFVSLALSAFLSLRLQRAISVPIAKLVSAARTITERKDYATRVRWEAENELGQLCSTFDRMLDEIQTSKEDLQRANDDLELRVEERTSQLTEEIHERKRVLVELEQAKDAAETANKAKSAFLANMSHEIRTPLNGVLGFADLLAKYIDQGDPERCRDYLKTIRASGSHLLVLINDVLDLSKIEAGQLEVESVPCSPHEVISQVTSVLRAQAQEKGLDLQYRWASKVPDVIVSDPARLRQLIMNVVGNAVKFTEEGFVCITARVDVPSRELTISVEDTGVGISSENQANLFKPFVQADTSVTRRFGGTGLGLAISRRLARAMGGDLELSSKEGQGSCFTARVSTGDLKETQLRPFSEAEVLAPSEAVLVESGQSALPLSDANILVVEDGPINRKLIRVILEEAGATVTLAENGLVGLQVGQGGAFDAILMDMQMPVMDGYTATGKLRESGFARPIVGLTAHAMTGDREKCLNAGCCGYLTKPIDATKLVGYLASRLGSPSEELADSTETDSQVTQVQAHDAGARLHSTLPVDKPIYAEIVVEFSGYIHEMLNELKSHLANEEFDALAKVSHSLKGSGGSAGFPAFTEPAKQLEQCAKQRDAAACEKAIGEIDNLANRIVVPSIPDSVQVAERD